MGLQSWPWLETFPALQQKHSETAPHLFSLCLLCQEQRHCYLHSPSRSGLFTLPGSGCWQFSSYDFSLYFLPENLLAGHAGERTWDLPPAKRIVSTLRYNCSLSSFGFLNIQHSYEITTKLQTVFVPSLCFLAFLTLLAEIYIVRSMRQWLGFFSFLCTLTLEKAPLNTEILISE